MRSISILGSTGSVGDSTLKLLRQHREDWRVEALTAHCSAAKLAKLAREFDAKIAVVSDESCLPELRDALSGTGIEAAGGRAALIEAASRPVDITMAAIVGCAGLAPVMAAIEQGGTIALANKEALVSAGEVMTGAVAKHGAALLPVDSEHNAIFQCLAGNDPAEVRMITLTASGGPLRLLSTQELERVTPDQAVAHPNWDMGAKISVDSATMFNKGLELIEAHHLFPVGLDKIRILVHPQSVIHSMVEYRDHSTLAQLGPSDMMVPIASCLAWPKRMETPCEPLDLAGIGELTFFAPDEERFPATRLARAACEEGGATPAILNAANEIAVAAFLAGHIPFTRIATLVENVLQQSDLPPAPGSLDDVLAIDAAARRQAQAILENA
ncbi:1-deoxy-D-xylulose-5-phosphate reductoisomerase [Alteriqipengyuania sp.]|uniref:1-deoxy-D-xylulose-5-phosphate reductoisomerase n=1 Tax=Alteriqipengyuania sp. TaxID=2800692 RepID=UPI003518D880